MCNVINHTESPGTDSLIPTHTHVGHYSTVEQVPFKGETWDSISLSEVGGR